MIEPNKNNFCGGNFQDWVEVMLLPNCNGKCVWCVEKLGWHPTTIASTPILISSILNTNKKNVILLGGEPTLHKDLPTIIKTLYDNKRNVFITTNGSNTHFDNISYLTGINFSIHSSDLRLNREITGIRIIKSILKDAVHFLKQFNVLVRFNCNLIKGYVDSKEKINDYIDFAKDCKADSVRFAELKNQDESFVDATQLMGSSFGLNNDPFVHGCNTSTTINNMPVNFRQMCGFQTPKRPKYPNPLFFPKSVVYYDGIVYPGWQQGVSMKDKKIMHILNLIKEGKLSPEDAYPLLVQESKPDHAMSFSEPSNSSNCLY